MLTNITITKVNQKVTYFICFNITLKWQSFGNSIEKLPWLLNCDEWLDDDTMKSTYNSHMTVTQWLHCKVIMTVELWRFTKWHHNEVTWQLSGNGYLETLMLSYQERCFDTSHMTSYRYHFGTRRNVTSKIISQWIFQITFT